MTNSSCLLQGHYIKINFLILWFVVNMNNRGASNIGGSSPGLPGPTG